MEIEGKIIAVLPARGGTSARTGAAWKSQEFVIETFDQYPRKCVFRIFGEDRLNQMNVQLGEVLRVSFDIDAHEYNGRWYNDVSAWRVDRNVSVPSAGQPVATAPAQSDPAVGQPAAPASDCISTIFNTLPRMFFLPCPAHSSQFSAMGEEGVMG